MDSFSLKTSQQQKEYQKTFLTDMWMNLYFRARRIYTKDKQLEVFLNDLFGNPSVKRTSKFYVHLNTKTTALSSFKESIQKIKNNLQENKYNNFEPIQELKDHLNQMDKKQLKQVSWILK